MSLVSKAKILKEKNKNIVNSDYAKASQVRNSENPLVMNFLLELKGSFKMVLIEYTGEGIELLSSSYNGLSVKHINKKIIVRNLSNIDLVDNILFKFQGVMLTIKLVRVFRWSEQSILAEIELPRLVEIFDKNSNIISNPVYKFKERQPREKKTDAQEKEMKKFEKDLNIMKSESNIIPGLYTNGYKFLYKGKRYRGNYHYNYNIKRFMSGSTLTEKSVKLDKIFKVGESLKNKGRRLSVGGLGNPDPRKPRL